MMELFEVAGEKNDGTLQLYSLNDDDDCEYEGKFTRVGDARWFKISGNNLALTYRVLKQYNASDFLLMGTYNDFYYMRLQIEDGEITGVALLALDDIVEDVCNYMVRPGEYA